MNPASRRSRSSLLVHGGALAALVACVLPWATPGERDAPFFGWEGLGGLDFPEGRILWTLALAASGASLLSGASTSDATASRVAHLTRLAAVGVLLLGVWVLLRIDDRALVEYGKVRAGAFIEFADEFATTPEAAMDSVVESLEGHTSFRFGAALPAVAGLLITVGAFQERGTRGDA